MSPRWGFGAGWVALAIDMPPLWGFWVFGLDMLCDIHCAPLERRDWKDRRSIDISLLWSERHISARWGYRPGKMPDLQQDNHKGCPYKDRPNVVEGSPFYRHIAPLKRKTHVASPGLWVGQDARPTAGQPQGLPLQRPTQCRGRLLSKKKRNADLRSLRIKPVGSLSSGKMLDLRVCVQVTAYGVCLLLANWRGFR